MRRTQIHRRSGRCTTTSPTASRRKVKTPHVVLPRKVVGRRQAPPSDVAYYSRCITHTHEMAYGLWCAVRRYSDAPAVPLSVTRRSWDPVVTQYALQGGAGGGGGGGAVSSRRVTPRSAILR
eukprot:7189714-Prymnesium_polylepis.1